jgi:hypothetical protein
MILPKISLPKGFYKLPINDFQNQLNAKNISPLALTTVALAANENLISNNDITSATKENFPLLYKKCLTLINEHISQYSCSNVSISLHAKNKKDLVDFDEVKKSLGLYFTASIDCCFEVDLYLYGSSHNALVRRTKKVLSLIAHRLHYFVPSTSGITLNESTIEYEVYEEFQQLCKKTNCDINASNFLKLMPDNEIALEDIDDIDEFLSVQRWYDVKRKSTQQKKIKAEIAKIQSVGITKILTELHDELETLITKFQLYCQNDFGFKEETDTFDCGFYVQGNYPNEDYLIDMDRNMKAHIGEPAQDLFYPNKAKGLTYALEFYQGLGLFCNKTPHKISLLYKKLFM